MSEAKDSRLAKYYSLQENGEWDAKFTGIITVVNDNVCIDLILMI